MASVEYVVTLVVSIELIQAPWSMTADPDGELMRHIDDVVNELEHRWIEEPRYELDLTSSEATFWVVVSTADQPRAIGQAKGIFSMAVHAAGGAEPHRPFPKDATWSLQMLTASASSGETLRQAMTSAPRAKN